MPTPFKALGLYNGFPFRALELAVNPINGSIGMTVNDYNSLYATWNGGAFSGLSSGQGFSQPFNNILDAMPFYWNLYNFYLSASVSTTVGSNIQSASVDNLEISQTVQRDPKNRIGNTIPSFRDNDSSASIYFFFNRIYYFGTGANKKYYWGLVGTTSINPGVSGGSISPRTYERRQNLNEYEDFILTITSNVKIAMAFYSPTTAFDSVTATASVNSVNYYTY